jgi:hypothetical protein
MCAISPLGKICRAFVLQGPSRGILPRDACEPRDKLEGIGVRTARARARFAFRVCRMAGAGPPPPFCRKKTKRTILFRAFAATAAVLRTRLRVLRVVPSPASQERNMAANPFAEVAGRSRQGGGVWIPRKRVDVVDRRACTRCCGGGGADRRTPPNSRRFDGNFTEVAGRRPGARPLCRRKASANAPASVRARNATGPSGARVP